MVAPMAEPGLTWASLIKASFLGVQPICLAPRLRFLNASLPLPYWTITTHYRGTAPIYSCNSSGKTRLTTHKDLLSGRQPGKG